MVRGLRFRIVAAVDGGVGMLVWCADDGLEVAFGTERDVVAAVDASGELAGLFAAASIGGGKDAKDGPFAGMGLELADCRQPSVGTAGVDTVGRDVLFVNECEHGGRVFFGLCCDWVRFLSFYAHRDVMAVFRGGRFGIRLRGLG